MFTSHQARRVVILADSSLKEIILDKVTDLGAKGYNYVFCYGKGVHALTGHNFSGENIIRIEVVTTNEIATAILDFIHAAQFAQLRQYALSAFSDIVEVDQRDKAFD